jgi:hypothetical protein
MQWHAFMFLGLRPVRFPPPFSLFTASWFPLMTFFVRIFSILETDYPKGNIVWKGSTCTPPFVFWERPLPKQQITSLSWNIRIIIGDISSNGSWIKQHEPLIQQKHEVIPNTRRPHYCVIHTRSRTTEWTYLSFIVFEHIRDKCGRGCMGLTDRPAWFSAWRPKWRMHMLSSMFVCELSLEIGWKIIQPPVLSACNHTVSTIRGRGSIVVVLYSNWLEFFNFVIKFRYRFYNRYRY